MNRQILAIICFSFFLLWNHRAAHAEEILTDEKIAQWRKELESDINLWVPLFTLYNAIALPWDMPGNETAVKFYESKRADLVSRLQQNPNSSFATDIKLGICMWDARILKDKTDALQMLQSIRTTKSTIPSVHFGVWIGLVDQYCSRPSSREQRIMNPLDEILRNVKNNPSVKAQFAAVFHLKKFPVMASDVATLVLADIYAGDGRLNEAIALLETFLRENSATAATMVSEDKKYCLHPDGYYITTIQRPAAQAVGKLMELYCRQGKDNAAIATGETYSLKLSEDGWYHRLINEPLADTYLIQGEKSKAKSQYQIALSGYIDELKREADLVHRCKKRAVLLDKEHRIIELKKKIRNSGGDIKINAKEVKRIFD